ncbi:MAG: hypothetical protein IPM96_17435 [Ignavibacteria bacterium]|nr:hypothetical protein [Ignavibacteria bacterium]
MKTKFFKFLFLLWLFNLSNAYSQYNYIEYLKRIQSKYNLQKLRAAMKNWRTIIKD